MTAVFQWISVILFCIGIPMMFNITPASIMDDIMDIIRPKDKLRFRVEDMQRGKQDDSAYSKLIHIRNALDATGKGGLFPLAISAAATMFVVGILIAIAIGNAWLAPSLAIALATIPFNYITNTIDMYDKNTKDELETALSIVTGSYMRTDNIITAVEENIDYIKPPLKHVFNQFLDDATFISTSTKHALYNMRDKVSDQVFYEWVTTLIQCQDDRTMKDNLPPIVSKLTDIRIVNNQLETMMRSFKIEYYTMGAMVIGNYPLLYFVNKDWFETLVYTDVGRIIQGITGIILVITWFFMKKYTKPIEYKK